MKVFDWIQAAELIEELSPKEALAGLRNYMYMTAVMIWKDGQVHKNGWGVAASEWYTPNLRMVLWDGNTIDYECWRHVEDAPKEWIDKRLALRTVNWPADVLVNLEAQ